MIRPTRVLGPAFVALLVLVCSTPGSGYEPTWVPAGLSRGDTYHLVFVTNGTFAATNSLLSWYDTQVDTAGDTMTGSPYGDVAWSCIGSVIGTDANSHTDPGTSPVYRLDGLQVATNAADLWDGAIANPISEDETGNPVVAAGVWTGSNWTGAQALNRTLGEALVGRGNSSATDTNWAYVAGGDENNANMNHLYAMSEELTVVVPEPSTVVLSIMGLAAAAGLRRRRRRSPK